MKRKTIVRLAVACSALGAGLFASTGTAFAWDQGTCPSNVRDSHDRLCYIAYDSTNGNPIAYDWIALHVYTGAGGHDYVWANGSNRWSYAAVQLLDTDNEGNVIRYDQLYVTGAQPFQLEGYGSGARYDGPGNNYRAVMYLEDASHNIVESLYTLPN